MGDGKRSQTWGTEMRTGLNQGLNACDWILNISFGSGVK